MVVPADTLIQLLQTLDVSMTMTITAHAPLCGLLHFGDHPQILHPLKLLIQALCWCCRLSEEGYREGFTQGHAEGLTEGFMAGQQKVAEIASEVSQCRKHNPITRPVYSSKCPWVLITQARYSVLYRGPDTQWCRTLGVLRVHVSHMKFNKIVFLKQ